MARNEFFLIERGSGRYSECNISRLLGESDVDSGYYAAFTGLLARTQALDEVANNLANTNTNGFRAERDFFRNTVAGPHAIDSQLNTAVNNFGVLGGNRVDLSQSQMT